MQSHPTNAPPPFTVRGVCFLLPLMYHRGVSRSKGSLASRKFTRRPPNEAEQARRKRQAKWLAEARKAQPNYLDLKAA